MSRQHIHLKTETKYYQAITHGEKYFEVRKNDRDFQWGDILYLQESVNGILTGREFGPIEIKYILPGGQFGIDADYCVLQLSVFDVEQLRKLGN
jgi:hypothetical protein